MSSKFVKFILHANFFMFILLIRSGSCNFSFVKNSLVQTNSKLNSKPYDYLYKLHYHLRHTRVHAARISRMSRGKNGVRNRLCFWPKTQRLYACWNFVVSCSSLSGDSAELRYVPLYIADQVEFRCSFYKNFTLLHSKFTYEKD